MAQRFRKRLTYANVTSSLALFVALGGVAWAALPKNSVTSTSIRNGAVKSVDIRDNTIRGVDVDEETLGGVRFAAQAGSAGNAGNSDALGGFYADDLDEKYKVGRAYGVIRNNGSLLAGRSYNIVGSRRIVVGTYPNDANIYCVALAQHIDVNTVAPVLTIDAEWSRTDHSLEDADQGFVEWDSVPDQCLASEIEVESILQGFYDNGTSNSSVVQQFSIFIP